MKRTRVDNHSQNNAFYLEHRDMNPSNEKKLKIIPTVTQSQRITKPQRMMVRSNAMYGNELKQRIKQEEQRIKQQTEQRIKEQRIKQQTEQETTYFIRDKNGDYNK